MFESVLSSIRCCLPSCHACWPIALIISPRLPVCWSAARTPHPLIRCLFVDATISPQRRRDNYIRERISAFLALYSSWVINSSSSISSKSAVQDRTVYVIVKILIFESYQQVFIAMFMNALNAAHASGLASAVPKWQLRKAILFEFLPFNAMHKLHESMSFESNTILNRLAYSPENSIWRLRSA